MDATTMPSTHLLPRLQHDFPAISFVADQSFLWSPQQTTVFYDPSDASCDGLLLHELAHGLLEHHQYSRDVQLVAMETEAWTKASDLAKIYGVTLEEDAIQDHLDTYRDWLHARSRCPSCEATGLQQQRLAYRCLACGHEWRVNEARVCALRRYASPKQKTSV